MIVKFGPLLKITRWGKLLQTKRKVDISRQVKELHQHIINVKHVLSHSFYVWLSLSNNAVKIGQRPDGLLGTNSTSLTKIFHPLHFYPFIYTDENKGTILMSKRNKGRQNNYFV